MRLIDADALKADLRESYNELKNLTCLLPMLLRL